MQPEMAHPSPLQPARSGRVLQLNRDSLERSARTLLSDVLVEKSIGEVAMVSSFGAESAVLLHLISQVEPATPVMMLDTGHLFEETLIYQRKLARVFGLKDVRRLIPDAGAVGAKDPDADLYETDPDACCHLRKTAPLERALTGFSGWITGRKRFQTGTRASIRVFEEDSENRLIKINPLAFWEPYDLKNYFEKYDLPRHPLVKKGYPSIGCRPCTTPVKKGEDQRSGRWRNHDKDECGIHIENGKIIRKPA